MRRIAVKRPGTGACTLASAMELWAWTFRHLQEARDAEGKPVFRDKRQGATFAMADALCWLLAAHCQILDVLELEPRGGGLARTGRSRERFSGPPRDDWLGTCVSSPISVTCRRPRPPERSGGSARNSSSATRDTRVGTRNAPAVFGGRMDAFEGVIPGISVGARITGDVVEDDGSHVDKAGPCVRFAGLYEFMRRRSGWTLASPALAWPRIERRGISPSCQSPLRSTIHLSERASGVLISLREMIYDPGSAGLPHLEREEYALEEDGKVLVCHGLERDGVYHTAESPTVPSHADRERPFNLEVASRVAHTACHRGGSVLIDGDFGGKPCHAACVAREIPSPERKQYGIGHLLQIRPQMRIVT